MLDFCIILVYTNIKIRNTEDEKMKKTYEIINLNTDEKLGEVEATNVVNAEYKACGIWPEVPSQLIAAFTKEQ